MVRHTFLCRCEHEFNVDLPDVVSVGPGSPERNGVIEGTYLSFICEACGNSLRPDIELRFRVDDQTPHILLVPEKERDRFLFENSANPAVESVVIGFPELRERLIILDCGYDFRAIEILKCQILLRADAKKELRIYYERTNDDNLEFSIHGLRDGEIALLNVPRPAYTRALSDLADTSDNALHKALFDGAYVSIHKLEIETDL